MLTKIQELIEKLNISNLRYCHWKSNISLPQSLAGQTDIDLLIHRKDADAFRAILSELCFRPTLTKGVAPFPSVEHYFAFDEESGVLVHVHAYYRVITGESLSKSFHLPLEGMLLGNTRELDSVKVPTGSAELVIFTLRMMLKHTSLIELLLLSRDWENTKREMEWLLESGSIDQTVRLVERWLPSIDTQLFSKCFEALRTPAPLVQRMVLGHRLRSSLGIYARTSRIWAFVEGLQKFFLMAYRRLFRSIRGMTPQSGGAIIAFVGPEATGKSTLLNETKKWLGEHFAVEYIHVGKPRSTVLTVLPNLIVPALRLLLPSYRSNRIITQHVSPSRETSSQESYPLIFAIRSVLLAYDRRRLLSRAFAHAANGIIVLCDRYPSASIGAPDSPQLSQFPISKDRHPILYRLASIEKQLYLEIPSPDLVISLTVPVEVAILRNRNRGKMEPEDYVRMRHAQSSHLEFEKTHVEKINTDQPLERTTLAVKKAIWNVL